MKRLKQILCLALVVSLLSAAPIFVRAEFEEDEPAVDLRTADVSGYPTVSIGGGFHWLYHYEPSDLSEHQVRGEIAFDPGAVLDIVMPLLDVIPEALKGLNFNLLVDKGIEAFQSWYGPIQMDENGDSIEKDLSYEESNWDDWQLYGQSDYFQFGFDWRLDPMENAKKLDDYLTLLEETRSDKAGQYNFLVTSGSAPILFCYLKHFDPEMKRLASLVLNISMHNGVSMWGELAKGNMKLDTESLGKLKIEGISMGGGTLDVEGIPPLQPLLRILYEIGLFELPERIGKLAVQRIIDRVYEEVMIPYIFTMPSYWTYVPQKDYEAAKKFLLSDPKYAGLVGKLEHYFTNVLPYADDMLLAAAAKMKVGVRAGYGFPMWPIAGGTAVQSDNSVDTVYASLGATCSPVDQTFAPWYQQAKDCGKQGHNHISPDRMIDASTCLLPEQTWFAKNKPHGTENSYSGWYDWFRQARFLPTVINDDGYPQYVNTVLVPDRNDNTMGDYEPLVMEGDPDPAWLWALKAAGLWLLKIWRWLLRLPLFWV